ncbi:esterase YqiA [Parashewanella spongiae]|uniref:Esterase YqiA n=1 Tax=Parashewanella spongiae TaxID=342950 RepID=A0A3A6U090_9GAMM|nr:YqiA/YcfP family alpha/beta fold hydrolase [Parashewanella spongiae]MCL1078326.1 esterase YqiA [Parashewanella spongiae]RJY17477.1 esterase YqiA [Parashewanella spongiae]
MLLYIHGFNSSPLSDKGIQTAEFIQRTFPELNFCQPQLPNCAKEAIELLSNIVQQAKAANQPLRYIGSSLGGYFATHLAQHYGGKAVLINPVVKPYELMEELLGTQYNPFTEQSFEVTPEHQQWLKEIDSEVITHPDRFFVLLQTGDEVLDYRQAVNKYHCCKMLIEPNGDHGFVDYKKHLPEISNFLKLTN